MEATGVIVIRSPWKVPALTGVNVATSPLGNSMLFNREVFSLTRPGMPGQHTTMGKRSPGLSMEGTDASAPGEVAAGQFRLPLDIVAAVIGDDIDQYAMWIGNHEVDHSDILVHYLRVDIEEHGAVVRGCLVDVRGDQRHEHCGQSSCAHACRECVAIRYGRVQARLGSVSDCHGSPSIMKSPNLGSHSYVQISSSGASSQPNSITWGPW